MYNKLLFILFLSALAGCNPSVENVKKSMIKVTATEAEYLTTDSTLHVEINLVYPVISANTSEEILNSINNNISQEFYNHTHPGEFKESHQNLPSDYFNDSTQWFGQLHNTYGLTVCDSILNVWFTVYQYHLGAAHGFTSSYSQQFNLNTGELLPPSNFFKTDSTSLQKLKMVINQNLPDSMCLGIDADSNILNVAQNFALSPDSITFKINDYALCPYAFGVNSIIISRQELADVLLHPQSIHCNSVERIATTEEIATH